MEMRNRVVVHPVLRPSDGVVLDPLFHDGGLLGVLLTSKETVELTLSDAKGDVYCLTLVALRRLRINEFRQGNIILDVVLYRGDNADVPRLDELYDLDAGLPATKIFAEKLAQEWSQGNLTWVAINPSYGASLQAICAGFELAKADGAASESGL